ncbi:MAG TPA: histidine phosphatase family protein [Mesorhizobium sp.]|jgi:phosphohistidine phosphatase SixA|nr:histidine phosphatase family protein [Mesorhizobium sp.]
MVRMSLLALLSLLLALPAQATEAGWALLREGGQVVLLRHARAPGVSDPANFDVENCATQRNLSDAGESQARRIGALFAARAAPTERVLSSRYCRALDTARIAFGEELVEPFAPLDRFSRNELGEKTLAEVLGLASSFTGSGNFVMVTHAENISALTGQSAREGEAVIVRAEGEGLRVIGRVVFN